METETSNSIDADTHTRLYALTLLPTGSIVTADRLDELIAALPGMDGYLDIPAADPDAGFNARLEHLLQVATAHQAMLVSKACLEDGLDLHTLEPDVLQGLCARRSRPVEVDCWTHPVPLVTLSVLYHPFSELEPPTGNVIMLDPYTERSHLESLAELGLVELHVAACPTSAD